MLKFVVSESCQPQVLNGTVFKGVTLAFDSWTKSSNSNGGGGKGWGSPGKGSWGSPGKGSWGGGKSYSSPGGVWNQRLGRGSGAGEMTS